MREGSAVKSQRFGGVEETGCWRRVARADVKERLGGGGWEEGDVS